MPAWHHSTVCIPAFSRNCHKQKHLAQNTEYIYIDTGHKDSAREYFTRAYGVTWPHVHSIVSNSTQYDNSHDHDI